jgi:cation diffusion facilitator family transporter
MIFGAAAAILVTSVPKLFQPEPLERLGVGLAVTLVATVLNGVVGIVLLRAGRAHRSATLRADGQHLLTDVWTSVGVIFGVALVMVTGWQILDPIVAIAVAVNILIVGTRLIREAMRGLLDIALPAPEHDAIVTVLARHATGGVTFHGLQTRESGKDRFMSVHVLVPGAWSVQRAHDVVEDVERDLREAVADLEVMSHLEPKEDPRAYGDYWVGSRSPRKWRRGQLRVRVVMQPRTCQAANGGRSSNRSDARPAIFQLRATRSRSSSVTRFPISRRATFIRLRDLMPNGPAVGSNPGTVSSPANRRAIEKAWP